MKSIKIVEAFRYKEDTDDFAPLDDMEGLEVVMYNHHGGGITIEQIERLEEQRPDLLLI